MSYQLHIYENAEITSRVVAELIKEKAKSKQADGEKLNIAISGGSTPKQLFTMLGDEYEKSIPWSVVRFFWVDERCVEPANAESNFGMTYDALLQRTFVHSENVFRMKGEDIPQDEVERYRKLLLSQLPAKHGFPVFDLVILGMGEDGHTASIFPNSMNLLKSHFSVELSLHPVSKQKRITLTGSTINNAKKVIFLVTGESKADLIKQIVRKEPFAQRYPAAHIQLNKANVDLYLDELAASKLI